MKGSALTLFSLPLFPLIPTLQAQLTNSYTALWQSSPIHSLVISLTLLRIQYIIFNGTHITHSHEHTYTHHHTCEHWISLMFLLVKSSSTAIKQNIIPIDLPNIVLAKKAVLFNTEVHTTPLSQPPGEISQQQEHLEWTTNYMHLHCYLPACGRLLLPRNPHV